VNSPPPLSYLVAILVIQLSSYFNEYVQGTLFYLIMAPKHKNNDVGNLGMPKTTHKVPCLNEKARFIIIGLHTEGNTQFIDLVLSSFNHPLRFLEGISLI
jgi:hypothetical protein